MSIIALLNSLTLNLEWLALRYLHLREANLFNRSKNVSWSSSKEVVFLRVNSSLFLNTLVSKFL